MMGLIIAPTLTMPDPYRLREHLEVSPSDESTCLLQGYLLGSFLEYFQVWTKGCARRWYDGGSAAPEDALISTRSQPSDLFPQRIQAKFSLMKGLLTKPRRVRCVIRLINYRLMMYRVFPIDTITAGAIIIFNPNRLKMWFDFGGAIEWRRSMVLARDRAAQTSIRTERDSSRHCMPSDRTAGGRKSGDR